MFIVVGLMYANFPWAATLAFWLFIAAGLTDWIDGWLARRSNQVSAFGRFMDAMIDKVMVLGVLIALVNGGYFQGHNIAAMWLLLAVLCREFSISGLRMAAASKGVVIEANSGGKIKTFTQFSAIIWLLGAHMLAQDFGDRFGLEGMVVIKAVHWIGVVLYILSGLIAVASGLGYFCKHSRTIL